MSFTHIKSHLFLHVLPIMSVCQSEYKFCKIACILETKNTKVDQKCIGSLLEVSRKWIRNEPEVEWIGKEHST